MEPSNNSSTKPRPVSPTLPAPGDYSAFSLEMQEVLKERARLNREMHAKEAIRSRELGIKTVG